MEIPFAAGHVYARSAGHIAFASPQLAPMGRATLAGLLALLLCSTPALLAPASAQQLPTSPLSGLTHDELLVLWDFLQSGVAPAIPPPAAATPPASTPAPPSTAPSTPTTPSVSPSRVAASGTAASTDGTGAVPLTVASITQAFTGMFSGLSASLPRLGAWLTNWGLNATCVH